MVCVCVVFRSFFHEYVGVQRFLSHEHVAIFPCLIDLYALMETFTSFFHSHDRVRGLPLKQEVFVRDQRYSKYLISTLANFSIDVSKHLKFTLVQTKTG